MSASRTTSARIHRVRDRTPLGHAGSYEEWFQTKRTSEGAQETQVRGGCRAQPWGTYDPVHAVGDPGQTVREQVLLEIERHLLHGLPVSPDAATPPCATARAGGAPGPAFADYGVAPHTGGSLSSAALPRVARLAHWKRNGQQPPVTATNGSTTSADSMSTLCTDWCPS